MRKGIAWVVCLVVIAAAVSLWWKYSVGVPSEYRYVENTDPSGEGVVGNLKGDTDPFDISIAYTENGFEPGEITVKKGQRVRFVNESKEDVWPASAIHPTHTLYPEKDKEDCLGSSFDACDELKPGEFFDFTFNYAGTWRYHDHMHGYQTGSIMVR